MANSGLCSRRKAEQLIEQGKVIVNGRKAQIGQSADVSKDSILVHGKPLPKQSQKKYFILNKPKGVETTLKSAGGLPTVVSLVKSDVRLVPAGRLDVDSRGLVFLTSDGELCHRVMHPRFPLDKVYEVTVHGKISDGQLELLRRGVRLYDGKTRPAKVELMKRSSGLTVFRITLHEGKKRQIRRMVQAFGFSVHDLVRLSIGTLSLDGISEGKSRELSAAELAALQKAVRLQVRT